MEAHKDPTISACLWELGQKRLPGHWRVQISRHDLLYWNQIGTQTDPFPDGEPVSRTMFRRGLSKSPVHGTEGGWNDRLWRMAGAGVRKSLAQQRKLNDASVPSSLRADSTCGQRPRRAEGRCCPGHRSSIMKWWEDTGRRMRKCLDQRCDNLLCFDTMGVGPRPTRHTGGLQPEHESLCGTAFHPLSHKRNLRAPSTVVKPSGSHGWVMTRYPDPLRRDASPLVAARGGKNLVWRVSFSMACRITHCSTACWV